MKKTNGVKFVVIGSGTDHGKTTVTKKFLEENEATLIDKDFYEELDAREPKPVTISFNSESVWNPKKS